MYYSKCFFFIQTNLIYLHIYLLFVCVYNASSRATSIHGSRFGMEFFSVQCAFDQIQLVPYKVRWTKVTCKNSWLKLLENSYLNFKNLSRWQTRNRIDERSKHSYFSSSIRLPFPATLDYTFCFFYKISFITTTRLKFTQKLRTS